MPTLRPYQEAGRDFLRSSLAEGSPRVRLLCDEMGLGKTVQACVALPGPLWEEQEPGVVVVCPAGLRRNWRRHFKTWRPDITATVLEETRDLRAPRLGEAVIVSPDALGWATGASRLRAPQGRVNWTTVMTEACKRADEALARMGAGIRALGWRAVFILDEAHRLKGQDAQRARATGGLVRPAVREGATCWALTATPMPRDAGDLWCLLSRMGADGHPVIFGGRGFAGWQDWANASAGQRRGEYKYGPPRGPLDAGENLGPIFLRRLVRDHLPEIPEPQHAIRMVSLSADVASLADDILRTVCRSLGVDARRVDQTISAAPGDDVDEALLREIRKIDRGQISKFSAMLAEVKAPVVLSELEALLAEGQPTIVYSEHRHTIDRMKDMGFPVVVGGMSEGAKRKAADLFQSGEAQALGFTGAGREGIDLYRAATMIAADTNFSVDDLDQAIGRFIRFGQEGAPSILHVLADHPIERLRVRALHRKRRMKMIALGSSL